MRVIDYDIRGGTKYEFLAILQIVNDSRPIAETFDFLKPQINSIEEFTLIIRLVTILN